MALQDSAVPPMESLQNGLYLLLENRGKPNNLGSILRCASAFGIRTIVAIGSDKCSVEGSHGASKHVDILAFPTGEQAATYLKQTCGCSSIVGLLGAVANGYGRRLVEESFDEPRMVVCNSSNSHDGTSTPATSDLHRFSTPVHSYRPSGTGSICFALCKARHGLPCSLAQHCDSFLHVPHHAPIATAVGDDDTAMLLLPLLDTPSCMSIVLHEITRQLNAYGADFHGHKYTVARAGRATAVTSTTKRRLRQQYMEECQKEMEEYHDDDRGNAVLAAGSGGLFGGDGGEVDGDY